MSRQTRALLVGCALTCSISIAQVSGVRDASARSEAAIPVTRCPTTYGGSEIKAPPVPRRVLVAASASALRAYSNGWLTPLAPAGWHCSGGVGADGNETLTVLPPYVTAPTEEAAAIVVNRLWNGVAVSTACGFFPELSRGIGLTCQAIPARELVSRLGKQSVAFEDPPGVRGSGYPSGGGLPANGLVAYVYQGAARRISQLMVGSATCTLPEARHRVCTAVLNDFLDRWSKVP